MRSAFACVFFALIIHREGSKAASDDFRPTPIPLNEWRDDDRGGRAGTLHETIGHEASPTVAIIPAHYWEDALRHSVYLTLVRDKIDQLIAKGVVISQNTKNNQQVSKEVDDHDLWEKIKMAPFDRIPEEDPSSFGDVAILARGRLLEEKSGYRFAEDERSKEKCGDEKCMDGVKAIWSVKRIRQRDHEASPGRYHYELTFSVISQTPKKQKKPYENPIRTFTVRESTPDRITEPPQEYKKRDNVNPEVMRPERAIWIHRNIVPTKYHLGRSYYHGLDRIFSSLFSDDDDDVPPEATPRHKSNSYVPQVHLPLSKTGYVGAPTDRYQQNVKYTPYPYKQPVKYPRPIPPPPISSTSHHHLDINSSEIPNGNQYNIGNQYSNTHQYSNGNYYSNSNQYNNNILHPNDNNQFTSAINQFNNGNPHTLQSDYKSLSSNKPIRTTRPAVLPTPLPPIPPTKDMSFEVSNVMRFSNGTTNIPETITVYKNYNKFRSPSSKINYFSDHVRPPIYNAPPGVFVTMDKKPFKPMPPLKLMPTPKPLRNNRPIDFRPSPQILDSQSTEKDSFVETAFRPITTGYQDNFTEYTEVPETHIKTDNKFRKTNISKKPNKKNDNTKLQKLTTNAPDIITAANVSQEDIETMEWANIISAFTKTTPMATPTEKNINNETTTPLATTESSSNVKRRVTTTTETLPEISTSTTPKPKKRTRPPPKFVKQDKIKKYKRVTNNSTIFTDKVSEKAVIKRPTKDLTPQASSAAVSSTKSLSETTGKTTTATITSMSTTSTSTITPPTTSLTSSTTSTTTTSTTTTTTNKPTTSTLRSTTSKASTPTTTKGMTTTVNGLKDRNRFRQSTLMLKGTSVKHDKWSSKNQTNPASSAIYRRKGSNFQGYLSSPMPNVHDKETRKRHPDRVSEVSTTGITEIPIKPEVSTQPTTTNQIREETQNVNETTDHYQEDEYDENEEEKNAEEDSKDHTEFIFHATTLLPSVKNKELVELEENVTSDQIVDTTPHASPKNKTKCKKKKINPELNEGNNVSSSISTKSTTTEKSTTTDIFQDLLDFNFGSTSEKENEISSPKPELDEEESENHEKYLKVDDDFKEFLDELGEKQNNSEDNLEEDEHYDDDNDDDDDDDDKENKESPSVDDEDSETTSEGEQNSGRHSNDYEDYQDRPYSFLELLAME